MVFLLQNAEIYRGIQMCARSGDLTAAISYLQQAQVGMVPPLQMMWLH